jgi:hypothetical protein
MPSCLPVFSSFCLAHQASSAMLPALEGGKKKKGIRGKLIDNWIKQVKVITAKAWLPEPLAQAAAHPPTRRPQCL